MNRTLAHPGFALLLLVWGRGARIQTLWVQSSVAEPTEPASTTAEPVPPAETRSPVEIAVAADLSSRGITATPTLAETVDVDGDGSPDSIFHAGTDVGCVLARTSGMLTWRSPAPLGTAPGLTRRCGPALPLPTGALLVVFADNGMAQMLATGRAPALCGGARRGSAARVPGRSLRSRLATRFASWIREAGVDEVVAAGADPALVPGEIRKFLRLDASGTWVSAHCWSNRRLPSLPTKRRAPLRSPRLRASDASSRRRRAHRSLLAPRKRSSRVRRPAAREHRAPGACASADTPRGVAAARGDGTLPRQPGQPSHAVNTRVAVLLAARHEHARQRVRGGSAGARAACAGPRDPAARARALRRPGGQLGPAPASSGPALGSRRS